MRFVWVLAIVALSPLTAHAQNLDLSRTKAPLDANGFLTLQSTTTPGHLNFNTSLSIDWTWRPLMLNTSTGDRLEVIADRTTTTLSTQLGIGGRFALGLAAPFVLWQSGNDDLIGGRPYASTAMGDPRISLRYRILGESAAVTRERNEGPGLAVELSQTLPLGSTDAFLGEGAARLSGQVLADFHVLGMGVGAMLGYRHRFQSRVLLGQSFGDEIELGVGLKVPIPVIRDFGGLVEFRSVTDTSAFFNRATTSAEIAVGARFRVDDVFFTGSVAAGIAPGTGTPVIRSTFDFVWAPRVHDMDRDGLPDDRDECPPLAEDLDGFEDENGCPDPDNDNDLIPDPDDRCPTETAEEDRDEDEDGCTDPAN